MERCTLRRKKLNFVVVIIFLASMLINFMPSEYAQAATNDEPKLLAKAAISIDIGTHEIIYAKGIDDKMFPASTTKLLTALLFAEGKSKSDLIKYTESAKAQPEYSLGKNIMQVIKVGDTMTADDVMKALLIFSANDSAYMIADSVAGSSDAFTKMMNDEAAKLNMKNSHFVTPNGLHNDNHYTTPYDLSLVARAAIKNSWIKDVLAIKKDTISISTGAKATVENRNDLLGVNGCIGGKTGFTDPAGKCLVAFYDRNGRQMVGVVMKSDKVVDGKQVFKDMSTMIDWSYNAKPTVKYENGTVLDNKKVTYKAFRFFGPTKTINVPVIVKDTVSYYPNEANDKDLKSNTTLDNLDPWKLSSDSKIGKLSVTQRETSKNYDLYTTITSKDLTKANSGLYIITAIVSIIAVILIALFIAFIISLSKRKSRRRYRY